MGILNLTPDSFSDGNRYLDPSAAAATHGRWLRPRDLIDVRRRIDAPGAHASRPMSKSPAGSRVRAVRQRVEVIISIDTTLAAGSRGRAG